MGVMAAGGGGVAGVWLRTYRSLCSREASTSVSHVREDLSREAAASGLD